MGNLAERLDRRRNFRGGSAHRLFDLSKVPLHGCNQKSVKNSILALRRGPIRYRCDATIVCEGDPAEYILLVVKGVVRSCRNFADGSRHIVAFHFAGEFFGLSDDPMSLAVEAATDTLVLFFKRSALLAAATQDSGIARYLQGATANQLRQAQEHSLLLTKRSESRVATFLIDVSMRMAKQKYLKLPMTYHDIADHLGLKIETFSRSITALAKARSIGRVSYRTLDLGDRKSLIRTMNRREHSSRRQGDQIVELALN